MQQSLFSRHTATLFQYAGIGLISWSISHGFFSTTRSFITAGSGILVFLIGLIIEKHIKMEKLGSISTLLIGIFFSIGTAMISGWAQHFLDSPWRSVAIMPLGYLVSLFMYQKKENIKVFSLWKILSKAIAVSLLIFCTSYFLASVITPTLDNDHWEWIAKNDDHHS